MSTQPNPRLDTWQASTITSPLDGYVAISPGPGDPKWGDQYEATHDAVKGWQLQISYRPTHENSAKVVRAMTKVFSYDHFSRGEETVYTGFSWMDFKCLVLNQSKTPAAEAQYRQDHPETYGKELCVDMHYDRRSHYASKAKGPGFHLSPEAYKDLMLRLWKALIDERVEDLGYAATPADSKRIPTEAGLRAPFSVTSYRTQQHQEVLATDNPLNGVLITEDDLKRYNIPLQASQNIATLRAQDPLCATEELANNTLFETEVRSLNELVKCINDSGFWTPKHRKQTQLPAGIQELQALCKYPPKSQREFYRQMRGIVYNRGSSGYKRDPMTQKLYAIFREVSALGTLSENQNFKELKAAMQPQVLGQEDPIVKLVNILKQDWKSRHNKKTQDPTGIADLKKCLSRYCDAHGNFDARHSQSFLKDCRNIAKKRKASLLTLFTGKRRDPETAKLYGILASVENPGDLAQHQQALNELVEVMRVEAVKGNARRTQ